MKAYLKNYRQSPRKVRLVASLVKGKTVARALVLLNATQKRATGPLAKMINSAAANAKTHGVADTGALVIKEFRVDKGLTMHRALPRAQGRSSKIDKHSSNIILTLAVAPSEKPKAQSSKLKTNKVTKPKTPKTKQ
ncbi:50S ribosomal protein L22 [Candidatus Campbellbacteria bacterium]|nr:MAG: 50S ribosomal protein L22 [Candidatus Campbellbacteria bacterium]